MTRSENTCKIAEIVPLQELKACNGKNEELVEYTNEQTNRIYINPTDVLRITAPDKYKKHGQKKFQAECQNN